MTTLIVLAVAFLVIAQAAALLGFRAGVLAGQMRERIAGRLWP